MALTLGCLKKENSNLKVELEKEKSKVSLLIKYLQESIVRKMYIKRERRVQLNCDLDEIEQIVGKQIVEERSGLLGTACDRRSS